MKTRVAHYQGEGFFPQTRRKYKSWQVIRKDSGSYVLGRDWSNPLPTQAAAQTVCDDYTVWFNNRATPVFS